MNQKIKCNTKKEVEAFIKKHQDCDVNSESYGNGIELLFCKSHTDYSNTNKIREPTTYVFEDTKRNREKILVKCDCGYIFKTQKERPQCVQCGKRIQSEKNKIEFK